MGDAWEDVERVGTIRIQDTGIVVASHEVGTGIVFIDVSSILSVLGVVGACNPVRRTSWNGIVFILHACLLVRDNKRAGFPVVPGDESREHVVGVIQRQGLVDLCAVLASLLQQKRDFEGALWKFFVLWDPERALWDRIRLGEILQVENWSCGSLSKICGSGWSGSTSICSKMVVGKEGTLRGLEWWLDGFLGCCCCSCFL